MGNGNGGDNCSYNTCKAPVKSSSSTNQHRSFYRPDALPVANQQCQSTEGITRLTSETNQLIYNEVFKSEIQSLIKAQARTSLSSLAGWSSSCGSDAYICTCFTQKDSDANNSQSQGSNINCSLN